MVNKNAICFRYKKTDGTMVCCCIQENKLWEDIDDYYVYLDMDDDISMGKLIDTLQSMPTYNDDMKL